VAFAVSSDASLKIFCAPVAVGRPLAESGCGLRSCAARRIVIDCFFNDAINHLGRFSAPYGLASFRATGHVGFFVVIFI
jgi:hypothetical protein